MALHPKRRPIEAERLKTAGIIVKDEPCLQQAEHTGLQRNTFTLFKGPGARRVRRYLRRQKQREQSRQALVHDDPWKLPAEIRREHQEAGIPTYRLVQGPIPEETRKRLEEFIERDVLGLGGFHKILVTDGPRGALMSEDGPHWLPPMGQRVHFLQPKRGPPAEGKMGRVVPITEDFMLKRVEIPLEALAEEPGSDVLKELKDKLNREMQEDHERRIREAFHLTPDQGRQFIRWTTEPAGILPVPRYSSMAEECNVSGCTWPGRHAHQLDEQGNPDPKRIIQEG